MGRWMVGVLVFVFVVLLVFWLMRLDSGVGLFRLIDSLVISGSCRLVRGMLLCWVLLVLLSSRLVMLSMLFICVVMVVSFSVVMVLKRG